MQELELLKLRPLLWEQQLICIKATYSKSARLDSYPKSVHFNKLLTKLSVGYFELNLHIYALGTSETYFTSCKIELSLIQKAWFAQPDINEFSESEVTCG